MRATTILCCLLVTIAACHSANKAANISSVAAKQAASKPLQQSILDSLYEWQQFNSITLKDEDSGYIVFLQDNNAVLALKDSFIISYTYKNDTWKIVDSMRFEDYPLEIKSLQMNDDYTPDVVITGTPQMNGNAENYILLGDSIGTLKCRPDLTNWQLTYDVVAKKAYSWFVGNINGGYKEVSRWQGDSLRLIEGIEWTSSYDGHDTLKRYKKKGKRRLSQSR